MDIKPSELLKQLKNGNISSNLFLLLGEELYFRSKILRNLKECTFLGVEEQDREIYIFERDTNLRAVAQAVNSYPFFCTKNMVILCDDKFFEAKPKSSGDSLSSRLEPLSKIIANLPDFCTLVISVAKFNHSLKIFKNIKEKGIVCESEVIKPANLAPWLKDAAAERGGKFDGSGIFKIMDYLAPVDTVPLDLLEKEIDKLVLFAGTDRAWSDKDVELVFSDLPQVGAFKLTEAIARRNLLQAICYLRIEQKRPNSHSEMIVGQLLWKLRMMIRVLELQQGGLSIRDMESYFPDIRSPSWQIKSVLTSLKGFTMSSLTKAFQDLTIVSGDARIYSFGQDRIFDRIEEILVELLGK